MNFFKEWYNRAFEDREAVVEEEGESDDEENDYDEDFDNPETAIKYMWFHKVDDLLLLKIFKLDEIKKEKFTQTHKLGGKNVTIILFETVLMKRLFDFAVFYNIKGCRNKLINNMNKFRTFTWLEIDEAKDMFSAINSKMGYKDENEIKET